MDTAEERATRTTHTSTVDEAEASASGVCWAAIVAGGVAIASLALILLALGVGLGLSVVSPWSASRISPTAIGLGVIAWLIFTHVAASGLGGYLAGRLRGQAFTPTRCISATLRMDFSPGGLPPSSPPLC